MEIVGVRERYKVSETWMWDADQSYKVWQVIDAPACLIVCECAMQEKAYQIAEALNWKFTLEEITNN